MIEMLLIYKWSILAGMISGAALSLVGSQLSARNQSIQSLVVSQSASLGVIIGLVINVYFFSHNHKGLPAFIPLVTGFITTAFLYYICEYKVSTLWPSRNAYYIGLFALLMSLSYSILAMIPSLESHTAASFFGDLALASDNESFVISIFSVIIFVVLLVNWRSITHWSFLTATFHQFPMTREMRQGQMVFLVSSLALIALSVQLLGLLFTLSCLFFPILIQARFQVSYARIKYDLAAATSASVLFGFLFSLWHDSMPTVPCIAFSLVILPTTILYIQSLFRRSPI